MFLVRRDKLITCPFDYKGKMQESQDQDIASAILTLRRDQALNSFWSFVTLMENSRIHESEHKEICDQFEQFYFSDEKIFILSCSRDTLKTSISLFFVLWVLMRDPNSRILLDARVNDQSKKRISNLQDIIESKRLFSLCFPNLRNPDLTWNTNEFDIATRTKWDAKEHSVESSSTESEKVGMHCNILILDDLVSNLNKLKEATEPIISHIKGMCPLLSEIEGDQGKIIWISTPFSDCDATVWINDIVDHSDIKHRKFAKAAYTPSEIDIYNYKTEKDFVADGGKLLFPKSLPFKKLKFDRVVMGVSDFCAQFLLTLLPSEDALFKTDRIRTISMSQTPQNVRFYVTIDQSGDPTQQTSPTKRDSDRTAIVVTAIDSLGKIYVVDGACGRFTETETVEFVFMFCQNYKREQYPLVCPEKIGMNALAANIRSTFRQRGIFIPVQEMLHKGRSKFSRIAELEVPIEMGEVFIIDTCPLKEALIYELKRFSRGGGMPKYDDISDALAWVMPLKAQYGMPMIDGSEQDTLLMEAVDGDSRNFQFWRGQRDARVKKASGGLVSKYSEYVYN